MDGWQQLGYALAGGPQAEMAIAQKKLADERKFTADEAEKDRVLKRQQLQLQAQQAGFQMDIDGQFKPAPGSEVELMRNMYSQLNAKLQEQDKYIKSEKTLRYLRDNYADEGSTNLNKLINDPEFNPAFKSIGITSAVDFDPKNQKHLDAYAKQFGPEYAEQFSKFVNEDSQYAKDLSTAYPLVTDARGNLQVGSMETFFKMSGVLKNASQADLKTFMDTQARVKQSITGQMQSIVDANIKQQEAEAAKSELEVDSAIKWLEANPDKTYADYLTTAKTASPQAQIQLQTAQVQLETAKIGQEKAKGEVEKINRENRQKAKELFISEKTRKQSLDNTITLLDELIAHPGREAAGGMTFPLAYIPGTEAYNFSASIDVIKSNIFLDAVKSMSGFGSLSDAEGKKLDAAVQSLDIKQTEEAMLRNLNIVRDMFIKSRDLYNSQAQSTDNRDYYSELDKIPSKIYDSLPEAARSKIGTTNANGEMLVIGLDGKPKLIKVK